MLVELLTGGLAVQTGILGHTSASARAAAATAAAVAARTGSLDPQPEGTCPGEGDTIDPDG